MGTAPIFVECGACGAQARRSFDIQFDQDYRRFRVGRSQATGAAYAESKAEERRIEKERGIVFTGRNDLTPKEKRLAEYARHVRAGGERVDPNVVNPPEVVKRKTVQQVLAEKKVSLRK